MGKSWKNPKKMEAAQKKGQVFSKLAKEIQVAARLGGGDPNANPRLSMAINAAKAVSCSKDTIERAIKKGSGELDEGQQIEEYTYEGYGPHGVGVIVECLSDNKNRTVADIKNIFNKKGGNMGETGSVSWMFDRVGLIEAKKESPVDDIEMEALEVEASDVEQGDDDNTVLFYTDVTEMDAVTPKLESRGWEIVKSELSYKAKNISEITDAQKEEVIVLLEALEDNDDSHRLYATVE